MEYSSDAVFEISFSEQDPTLPVLLKSSEYTGGRFLLFPVFPLHRKAKTPHNGISFFFRHHTELQRNSLHSLCRRNPCSVICVIGPFSGLRIPYQQFLIIFCQKMIYLLCWRLSGGRKYLSSMKPLSWIAIKAGSSTVLL